MIRFFKSENAKIFLVPTPIGNLGDITNRAVEIIKSADIVFCEDTRRASILMKHINISKKLMSFHSYNENKRCELIINYAKMGKQVVYISDSGTPGISDPGYSIVRSAQENNIPLSVLPGPTALTTALVLSGLPAHRFTFLGFPPPRSGARKKLLESLKNLPFTLVFYESPHKIADFLKDAFEILGNRNSAIVKEISKIFEEVVRGNLSELAEHFSKHKAKGEIVVIIEGIEK